jgi:hypothetical protein
MIGRILSVMVVAVGSALLFGVASLVLADSVCIVDVRPNFCRGSHVVDNNALGQ